ncbi:hypothetical protein DICVIV_11512 [Dictyocaulus viviparus]|uniref:ShKT domain-containing protein n=1 Tax=Dictyocaulus viviparus TaxID=29172 RepID=A0A0D8XFL9_DICVI|nr:hypothetical protein DICVIV_11512 [Dictyocaulus viviparus]
MCSNPTWRSVLVDDCPKTCGLCDQTGRSNQSITTSKCLQ